MDKEGVVYTYNGILYRKPPLCSNNPRYSIFDSVIEMFMSLQEARQAEGHALALQSWPHSLVRTNHMTLLEGNGETWGRT